MRSDLVVRLFLALSALPCLANAQSVATLALVPTGDREVGAVSPASGAVSLPGSPINGGSSLSTSSGVNALDPTGNRFFFVGSTDAGSTWKLFRIHPGTGAVLGSPTLSGGSTSLDGIQYDDGEGVLYALASVASGDRQLATVDIATGAVTLLFSPIAGGSLPSVSGGDDLDAAGNRYFFVGSPGGTERIYTVDTATGVVTSPVLSGATINGIQGLEYDPGEAVLYALASVGGSFDRQLATINPATGAVTLLGAPIAGMSLLTTSGNDTLDPAGNRYYFTGQPSGGNWKIYAINTTNGAVATNPDLSGDSTTLFGLEWDAGALPVELLGVRVD
ncbi:MAG: hypothetical protein IPJ17_18370 [Holophagales bacterium]|nr:MAG: hypothetical protein IPJ17_18370 [Holophagales bacterium]